MAAARQTAELRFFAVLPQFVQRRCHEVMHTHSTAKEVGRGVFRQVDPVRAAKVNGFLCKHRAAVVDHYERRNVAEISCVAAFVEIIRIKTLRHSRARDSAV